MNDVTRTTDDSSKEYKVQKIRIWSPYKKNVIKYFVCLSM